MRWIDFQNKKPTDSFEGWEPWPDEKWQTWLDKSSRLLGEMESLNSEFEAFQKASDREKAEKKLIARNTLIEKNSSHWGELKEWLKALSHGKCWFSEAKDIFNHWHVEHFRPKKQAKDDKNCDSEGKAVTRDGYWWLAFEYSNYRLCGSVGNTTKGGWFPLHKDSNRSTYAIRCEDSEATYLIDPTKQCDVALISYQEDGNAVPLEADEEDWDWKRADTSITRLGLNADDTLPEARRAIANELKNLITRFKHEKSLYRPGINEAPKGKMDEIARQIKAYQDETRPLSAFAKWYIESRNDKFISRLAA